MRILIASSIAPEAITDLERSHDLVMAVGAAEDVLADAIPGCEALVFRSGVEITKQVLDAAGDLKLVIRAGSGYDNIDLDRLASMKVRFVRIPGPGAKAVAELAFAMMLTLSRHLRWADEQWRQGRWVKSQAMGRLLTGKRLGIVGAGNIGRRTGALGAAWGMDVIGCVEHPSEKVEAELATHGIRLTDFTEVMSTADYVSVHVPLHESTAGLIDAPAIASMKPGAIIVNLSRGGVVDEAALAEALASGHLAGAGLDVHAVEGEGNIPPLASSERVLLTPHIGASTIDSQREIGKIVVECVNAPIDEVDLLPGTPDNFVVM